MDASRSSRGPHEVNAWFAYTRPEHVSVDPDRGLLRARTLDAADMNSPRSYDLQRCRVRDCAAPGALQPDLVEHGFTHVELGALRGLQDRLARVRAAGAVRDADARAIRRHLLGRALRLGNGARARVLFIAREGFLMRAAGPNGLRMHARAGLDAAGMNEHDAAIVVHADQDVDGTPVRQLLRGRAPRLFHHDSPGGANTRGRLHLVNLWIPLDQVTRPLALMDRRSLDRRAHQLRYGLPTDGFLKRRADRRVNDIWTFLHDPRQRWYFTSELDARRGYMFETFSTPHGSFVLPGEARAEALYHRLGAALTAVARADLQKLRDALAEDATDDHPHDMSETTSSITLPLRQAIHAMHAALARARSHGAALCRGQGLAAWRAEARRARARVIRKSIEMRAVVLVRRPR